MDSFGESNVIIIQRRLGTEFFSGSDDVIVWILDWRVGLGQFLLAESTTCAAFFHARIHAPSCTQRLTARQPWTKLFSGLGTCDTCTVGIGRLLWLFDSYFLSSFRCNTCNLDSLRSSTRFFAVGTEPYTINSQSKIPPSSLLNITNPPNSLLYNNNNNPTARIYVLYLHTFSLFLISVSIVSIGQFLFYKEKKKEDSWFFVAR